MYALRMTEVTESSETPAREWTGLELVLRSRIRAAQRANNWNLKESAAESGADRETITRAMAEHPIRVLRVGSWAKLYSLTGESDLTMTLVDAVFAGMRATGHDPQTLAVAAGLGYTSVLRALGGRGLITNWDAMLQALKLDPEEILK